MTEEIFRQFISEKRLQVLEGVARINEILRSQNAEAAKYLIHARDTIADGNLREILETEIDRVMKISENEEIPAVALQAIVNLEKLATIAAGECVLKYWNYYIDDVMKAFNADDVRECYEQHKVMNCAMEVEKKVPKCSLFN